MLVSKDTPPHPDDFTAAKRSSTFLQIEGAGNSLTGLLLPPPAKGTTSADWRPYQSHRTGPLGLQNPSRFLRKYLTPTFIALQSWHCFADLRMFSRSLFRGLGGFLMRMERLTTPPSKITYLVYRYSIFKFPSVFRFHIFIGRFFQNCIFGLQRKNQFTTNFKKLYTFNKKCVTIKLE